jgi:prevent-host-death family protein
MASREVSLFDAKSQFSRLVASAERGQVVTITRRGKPVARLVPATERPAAAASRGALLRRARSFRRSLAGTVDVRALVREGRRD